MSMHPVCWRRSAFRVAVGARCVPPRSRWSVWRCSRRSHPGGPRRQSTALPPGLQKFAHCPVGVATVATCLFSSTTSTTFTIGSTTVTSSSPTTVSLGLRYTKTGQAVAVLPDDGTAALQSPAIPLPGGLTGIPALQGGVLAVTVTPQLVGASVGQPGRSPRPARRRG